MNGQLVKNIDEPGYGYGVWTMADGKTRDIIIQKSAAGYMIEIQRDGFCLDTFDAAPAYTIEQAWLVALSRVNRAH